MDIEVVRLSASAHGESNVWLAERERMVVVVDLQRLANDGFKVCCRRHEMSTLGSLSVRTLARRQSLMLSLSFDSLLAWLLNGFLEAWLLLQRFESVRSANPTRWDGSITENKLESLWRKLSGVAPGYL